MIADRPSPERRSRLANLVVWEKIFEKYRRVVLSSGMIGVYGRIQRERDVVHLVAHWLTDLSADLASVGERGAAFPLPHGRGDEFHHGTPGLDPRSVPRLRNSDNSDAHIEQIRVKTRDFR